MGGMGLKLAPVLYRCPLGPLGLFKPIAALLELTATPNSSLNRRYNVPPVAHHPPHLPPSLPPTHSTSLLPTHLPLICGICDITVAVKKLLKSSSVSYIYKTLAKGLLQLYC